MHASRWRSARKRSQHLQAGPIASGLRHGQGRLVYSNGDVFEAVTRRAIRHQRTHWCRVRLCVACRAHSSMTGRTARAPCGRLVSHEARSTRRHGSANPTAAAPAPVPGPQAPNRRRPTGRRLPSRSCSASCTLVPDTRSSGTHTHTHTHTQWRRQHTDAAVQRAEHPMPYAPQNRTQRFALCACCRA